MADLPLSNPHLFKGEGSNSFVSYYRGRSRACAISRDHSPPAPLCGVGEAPPLCRGGGSLVTITYVCRVRGKEQGVKSQTRPRLPMCSTVDLSIMHRAPNTVSQKFRCTQRQSRTCAHTLTHMHIPEYVCPHSRTHTRMHILMHARACDRTRRVSVLGRSRAV